MGHARGDAGGALGHASEFAAVRLADVGVAQSVNVALLRRREDFGEHQTVVVRPLDLLPPMKPAINQSPMKYHSNDP